MSTDFTTSVDLPRIIIPKRHIDDRGWLSESFHKSRFHNIGITCEFVQDIQSNSTRAGTLRGLHFQLPPTAQAKLVTVMRGKILDVAVDVRRDSPSYGKHVSAELSAANGHQLYIPVGFAHGFVTLENNVLVMYKVSQHYSPAHNSGIRWNDSSIAFPWPFNDADITVSDKDRQLPFLSEFSSPFPYDGAPLTALSITPV